jgi:hypothetical protein
MGTFTVGCLIRNHVDREKEVLIPRLIISEVVMQGEGGPVRRERVNVADNHSHAKAAEGCRTPKRWRVDRMRPEKPKVLECGSRLPLLLGPFKLTDTFNCTLQPVVWPIRAGRLAGKRKDI